MSRRPPRYYGIWFITAIVLLVGCRDTGKGTPGSPVSPEIRDTIGRAQNAYRAGRMAEALHIAQSALAKHPNAPDLNFIAGRILNELGRLDDAERAYQAVVANTPEYEGAWHNLANISFNKRRYREAVSRYSTEIDNHPAPRPWHGLGGSYAALNIADSAKWALLEAVKLDSAYAPALASLADWHEREGEFDSALHYATKSHFADTSNVDYLAKAGTLMARLGQHDRALVTLEAAIRKRPWDHASILSYSQTLQRLGRTDEAKRYFEIAEEVRQRNRNVDRLLDSANQNPENFVSQILAADALRSARRYTEAVRRYTVAEAIEPANLDVQNNIATLLLQTGRVRDGISRFKSILAVDSTYSNAWSNLARYYDATGDQDSMQFALSQLQKLSTD